MLTKKNYFDSGSGSGSGSQERFSRNTLSGLAYQDLTVSEWKQTGINLECTQVC